MSGEANDWGKIVGIGLCVLALTAGGVWAGKYLLDQRAEDDVNAKLAGGDAEQMRDALLSLDEEKLDTEEGKETLDITVERMRDMSFSEIMEVMRSKDLTEEQRDHMQRIGREVMMASMNKNVDEYFAAPKDEKEKVLDRQIDEMMEFRKEMEAYREEHKDDPEHQAEEQRRHERWQRRDTKDAKERMEGGNPDQQKRMFFYWGKMRARAEARGIDMSMRGHRGSDDKKTDGKKSDRRKRNDKED